MQFVAKFYETYNICDVVSGFLRHPFDHARWLEGFHCDDQWAGWLPPYEKRSVLHRFIAFVVQGVHAEQADDFDIQKQKSLYIKFKDIPPAIADFQPHTLPIEDALEHHRIDHQTFFEFLRDEGKTFEEADADDIYEYMNEVWISAAYDELIEQTVDEVFHVLFQNRELMMMFNLFVSNILERVHWDQAEDFDRSLLASGGKLARVRPPSWARRAVFFRDRGRCVLCDRDLTGLLNIDNVGKLRPHRPAVQLGPQRHHKLAVAVRALQSA